LFDRPTIHTNFDTVVATVDTFMVGAAQALQCAKPEARHVAIVWFDMVHDVGQHGAAFGFTQFAQGMRSELVAPATSPAARVVGAAAIVGASTAATGVEPGYVVASTVVWHALMLARARTWRKADERACVQLGGALPPCGASAGVFFSLALCPVPCLKK
jgi:hypothetical protein